MMLNSHLKNEFYKEKSLDYKPLRNVEEKNVLSKVGNYADLKEIFVNTLCV